MECSKTTIPDLLLIESLLNIDDRGSFMESYHIKKFKEFGIDCRFKQDNIVKSKRNVLRGLHFQKDFPQAKLIRCLHGKIFDVCIDMRKKSPTYGKSFSQLLSAENNLQLYIPKNFAHGYYVLSDDALVTYKCSDIYMPNDEGGIIWNDLTLNIEWPCLDPILSDKDKNWPPFKLL